MRAAPAGDEPAVVALGVYAWNMPGGNANEVYRVIADGPKEQAGEHPTFDLGVDRLKGGATIHVRPNGDGSYGRIEAAWIDRVFLIAAE